MRWNFPESRLLSQNFRPCYALRMTDRPLLPLFSQPRLHSSCSSRVLGIERIMLWNRGKKRSQRISLLCERIRGPYNFFIRKAQGKSSRWIRDFLSDSGRISRGEIEFRVYIYTTYYGRNEARDERVSAIIFSEKRSSRRISKGEIIFAQVFGIRGGLFLVERERWPASGTHLLEHPLIIASLTRS